MDGPAGARTVFFHAVRERHQSGCILAGLAPLSGLRPALSAASAGRWPEDVLDLQATVEKAAREGFFVAPVYQRSIRNRAHLLLLVDQDGSMVPFHRFTRELVETASEESTLGQVNVFYFHNFFVDTVYTDPFLNDRAAVSEMLARCDEETSVLIVSDAGAARGSRQLERIGATTKLLGQLKLRTRLLAWLNPMPQERWEGDFGSHDQLSGAYVPDESRRLQRCARCGARSELNDENRFDLHQRKHE